MANFKSDLHMKGSAYEVAPIESAKLLNVNNKTASNQRALQTLRVAPKIIISLRHDFSIMQPARCIEELLNMGYAIDAVRVAEYMPDNIKNFAVAKYVLRGTK